MALTPVSISADELLDGAQTIPVGDIHTFDWLSHWVPAGEYLQRARRGLAEGDDHGLSNAITYAKRSVTCRIDLLLNYNHLAPFSRDTYPAKIEALRAIGLTIPDVVQELVIDPRNALEHQYERPSRDVARHAVGVAELFLRATDAEREPDSIVAVAWNVLGSSGSASGQMFVTFREFAARPMLFIDVLDEPHAAKIVDPTNREVRLALLKSFSRAQAVQLAALLRQNYRGKSLSRRGFSQTYYREMRRQGGF